MTLASKVAPSYIHLLLLTQQDQWIYEQSQRDQEKRVHESQGTTHSKMDWLLPLATVNTKVWMMVM